MANLKTITTKSGARFSVASDHADKFQTLLDRLEASGYQIDPAQSGGYNPRNIAGTNTPSQHSFGNAIDINWTRNARGKRGDIDPALAKSLADELGFTWGGNWSNPDDMHFEVKRDGPVPMQSRGLTSFAGVPAPQPASPQSAPPATPSQETASMDFFSMLAGLMGGSGVPAAGAAATAAPQFGSMAPAAPAKDDSQNQLAAQATAGLNLDAPQLQGQQMRQTPVDLSRLRQAIASRARLGTGVA